MSAWSPQEDELLMELVANHEYTRGTQTCVAYDAVAVALAEAGYERTGTACRAHYKHLSSDASKTPIVTAATTTSPPPSSSRWDQKETNFFVG